MRTLFPLLLILVLFACTTEEIARIDLTKTEPQSISINCKKHRQIDFYLDGDMEYKELPIMVLDFEFYKGNQQILKGGLDPLNCTLLENESKTIENGITRWKFYGKLEGNFIPPSDTTFTIYPTLIKNNHPDLKIHKLDVVFVR
ncbi:MAG: hypothetical protein HYU68_10130 [Bacteroidetes bacterium]|nr:hypothetical protein [Bacteroidota bacterium]